MKTTVYLMILASVGLTTSAQIALKYGMTERHIAQAILKKEYLNIFLSVAVSPFILGGLFLFAASVVIWLAVLASVPLSIAYPFVSLGICLTTIAGNVLFNETFTAYKALGVVMVVFGIVCISMSRIE